MEARDHARLRGQVPRLVREEQDLRERLAQHGSALDRAGREHRSDPLYQSLASVLGAIRRRLALAQGDIASIRWSGRVMESTNEKSA